MTEIELNEILDNLLALEAETETVEFKEAKNDFSFEHIGQYFSALSNEANLKGKKSAWLVFGVRDKGHTVVGTNYRPARKDLDSLKGEIAKHSTTKITFKEIYELQRDGKRVIMFDIPAAPKGIPIGFKDHYYGRDGESLSALNLEEIERIRSQAKTEDWSAIIVPDATIDDLDREAITVARNNYKKKFPDKTQEVDTWDDSTFLNKVKLTSKGRLTRTALLLLGKDESEHFLNPADPKIRWVLKDSKGNDRDYSLFGIPLLLAVDKLYQKIRNIKYRYLKEGSLFPEEVDQYDPFTIREAVNNCIAHQDYSMCGRINVVEMEDQLVFTNLGSFIPGDVERVVKENAPEEQYRNPMLVMAMFNLSMVDSAGGGIRRIYLNQRARFFPLPDYETSERRVKVVITGKVLDMNYARLLARMSELSLDEIIALDKVAKHKKLTTAEECDLKSKKLIEGRKPNFFIAKQVAQVTGQKAEYSKNKAFDKQYYLDLIIKALNEHGALSRKDIDELLWNKLPDWMDDSKRKNKVTNLLSELRMSGQIMNKGSSSDSKWVLSPLKTDTIK